MNPTWFEIDGVHLEFAHLTHECKLMFSIPGVYFPRLLTRDKAMSLLNALQVCVMEWDNEEADRVAAIACRPQTVESLYSPVPF